MGREAHLVLGAIGFGPRSFCLWKYRVERVNPEWELARPAGLEPATPDLEGRCSIQMSYGRVTTWYAKMPHP